jgi:large subunit ribosomal protein L15
MFTLHNLGKSTTKRIKRVGRGQGSQRGKNSGKGHKGQNKHGQGVRIGFEGGQKTLLQRTPKFRGFNSRPQRDLATFNSDTIENVFANKEVTLELLLERQLISSKIKRIRIIKGKDKTISFTVVDTDSIYLTKGVKSIQSQ